MQDIEFIQDLAVILAVAGVVGWVCQRIGLSVVVGFLVAGIFVGPHTPPFSLVTNETRIETAAQVGLVFLMFSIGLRLSLRRLRRLGGALVLAVAASAGMMYYLTKAFGLAVGLDPQQSLFLAGMLMVSSSVIISKVLQETGATHERSGQLALGVSVLEDVVAVVMMTVLTSMVQLGEQASRPALWTTLGMFGAFVVLAGIVGLLLVPWLLRKLSISANEELQTVAIAGLLFALAILADRAGYSLALGAFLLGTIVAETPHRHQVERTFEGLRDVFSAVFFVAIGMQIDVVTLWTNGPLILGVAAFTLVARTLAASLGLALIGTPPKEALRAGLTVTPIGEFSFIIAQLGVLHQVLTPDFYPLAVGVSLLTTLAAPFLTRRAEKMAGWADDCQPRWLRAWCGYYQGWLEGLQARQKRNLLWQLSRKRFIQISVEMLFVTGLLIFSEQLFEAVERWLGRDWLFPRGPAVLFWVTLCLVLLAPVVAIWRNISALSMLYAQVSTHGRSHAARLTPLVETCLKIAAGLALFVWLSSFLPASGSARWLVVGSVLIAIGALLLLKRKLVFWHSELEVELQGMLAVGDVRKGDTNSAWLHSNDDWNVSVSECLLPDLADCQGRSLAELDLRGQYGCTVVGIERQGFMIPLPGPEAVLYPRDKILLVGPPEQIAAGRKFLTTVSALAPAGSEFADVRMQALTVPASSQAAGRTLNAISPAHRFGVQVAGINRRGRRTLSPGADDLVEVGDELLVLGTPVQIRQFKEWVRESRAVEG